MQNYNCNDNSVRIHTRTFLRLKISFCLEHVLTSILQFHTYFLKIRLRRSKLTFLRFGEKESASWKDKNTERWKTKSPPILRKDLTLEILVIPRLITVIKKEDTYYLINTEI